MSLRLEELDAVYGTVSHEEAIAIANLGAQCYVATKERLYATWLTERDDTEQEELWRKEGGAAMLESLRARLAAGDAALARVTSLESVTEVETARRVEAEVALRMRELELAKREEVLVLKSQMAELQGCAKMMAMLEEAQESMKAELEHLREENEEFKAATATKSSHELGRIGEATVMDMLMSHVVPRLAYAEVRDMTKVRHAADFHLSAVGPTGKRYKIMIDVKKYVTPIKTGEIEKLCSDMDADESVNAGILVSMDSGIFTKEQFQIIRTERKKPCLFMTFQHIDDSMRKEMFCWAANVLINILSQENKEDQDAMIEEISSFVEALSALLVTLGNSVKQAESHAESLRDTHRQIMVILNRYKSKCGILSVTGGVAAAKATATVMKDGARCQGVRANGEQCKFHVKHAGEYCKKHSAMKESGEIVSLVD